MVEVEPGQLVQNRFAIVAEFTKLLLVQVAQQFAEAAASRVVTLPQSLNSYLVELHLDSLQLIALFAVDLE